MAPQPTRPPLGRPPAQVGAVASASPNGPGSMEERLRCIADLGHRIDGYVQFMCQIGSLTGTSAEAKEKSRRRLLRADGRPGTSLERDQGRPPPRLRAARMVGHLPELVQPLPRAGHPTRPPSKRTLRNRGSPWATLARRAVVEKGGLAGPT
jgi:hypothetical protein